MYSNVLPTIVSCSRLTETLTFDIMLQTTRSSCLLRCSINWLTVPKRCAVCREKMNAHKSTISKGGQTPKLWYSHAIICVTKILLKGWSGRCLPCVLRIFRNLGSVVVRLHMQGVQQQEHDHGACKVLVNQCNSHFMVASQMSRQTLILQMKPSSMMQISACLAHMLMWISRTCAKAQLWHIRGFCFTAAV